MRIAPPALPILWQLEASRTVKLQMRSRQTGTESGRRARGPPCRVDPCVIGLSRVQKTEYTTPTARTTGVRTPLIVELVAKAVAVGDIRTVVQVPRRTRPPRYADGSCSSHRRRPSRQSCCPTLITAVPGLISSSNFALLNDGPATTLKLVEHLPVFDGRSSRRRAAGGRVTRRTRLTLPTDSRDRP
jgi:hypothetical protein